METITATFAKNNIGEVWEKAKRGPVEVFRDGIPVAVIMSPEYFREMDQNRHRLGRLRQFGLLSDKLRGVEAVELLGIDVSDAFRGYIPE